MKHILVADDEPNIRLLFKEELEEEGYKVTTAEDGDAALRRVKNDPPDLVLLDIRMPNVNGLEFLGMLREINQELPVIICTALKGMDQEFEIWSNQVSTILNKPIDLEELKKTVSDVLNR